MESKYERQIRFRNLALAEIVEKSLKRMRIGNQTEIRFDTQSSNKTRRDIRKLRPKV